jgi:hypothetical protein
MKAYWGNGSVAPRVRVSALMEARAQLHTLAALPPVKEPLVPNE